MNELQSLFDTYKKSAYEKDLERFLSIFDENVQVFDMWGRWSYEGIAAWRKMAEGWFGSLGPERVFVEFDEVEATVSGDMAYARATVTYSALGGDGQKLRSLQNRLTWVARKKEGLWKIIHEHTSAPIDHPTLKAILKK